MLTKTDEKRQAIELRKSGLSYNEIKQKVNVSKSTLSLWLRSVGMAKRHARRLSEKQRMSQKKASYLWHQKRVEKVQRIKQQAAAEVHKLSDKEKWLIGICLYWAEGSKEKNKSTPVQFTNSDPHMVFLFREWIIKFLKQNPADIIYSLYIHERTGNLDCALGFWADFLGIEPHNIKIVFKKHNPSPKRKNIGVQYRGLIRMTLRNSTDMNRQISGWIDGIIVNAFIGE